MKNIQFIRKVAALFFAVILIITVVTTIDGAVYERILAQTPAITFAQKGIDRIIALGAPYAPRVASAVFCMCGAEGDAVACGSLAQCDVCCGTVPIDGVCDATHFLCLSGTARTKVTGATSWTWTCAGSGGGASDFCTEAGLVNGACSGTHYGCAAGTSGSNAYTWPTYTWMCNGSMGGTNASCSENVPWITSSPAILPIGGTASVNWNGAPNAYCVVSVCPATMWYNQWIGTSGSINYAPDALLGCGSPTFNLACGPNSSSVTNVASASSQMSFNGYCALDGTHYGCYGGSSINNALSSTAYTWNCTGTNLGVAASCTEYLQPTAWITTSAAGSAVSRGNAVSVSWGSTSAASCSITMNGAAWTSGLSGSGVISPAISSGDVLFGITCINGTKSASASSNAAMAADRQIIGGSSCYGCNANIQVISNYASNCVVRRDSSSGTIIGNLTNGFLSYGPLYADLTLSLICTNTPGTYVNGPYGGTAFVIPAITFTASAPSVTYGSPASLNWSTSYAASCTLNRDGSTVGVATSASGYSVGNLTSTASFILTCLSPSGISNSVGWLQIVVPPLNGACTGVAYGCSTPVAAINTSYTPADRTYHWQCPSPNGGTTATEGSSSLCKQQVCDGVNGTACASAANACGMTNPGTYNCYSQCSASAPADSSCPLSVVSVSRTTANGGATGAAYANEAGVVNWTATNSPSSCSIYLNGGFVTSLGAGVRTYTTPGLPEGTTSYRVDCTTPGGTGTGNTVTFVVPTSPWGMSASCTGTGASANFSWTLPGGILNTYFRYYNSPPAYVDYPTACTSGKTPPAGACTTVGGGNTSSATTPGTAYYWYIHSEDVYGNWSNAVGSGPFTCVPPQPAISAAASPIGYNTATNLTWSSSGATACSITNIGAVGTGGVVSTGNLLATRTFTITCTNAGGTSVSNAVTVTVLPVNGACDNTTAHACLNGTTVSLVPADSGTQWLWSCLGLNGGTSDATCNKYKPVNGACNVGHYGCTSGDSVSNVSGPAQWTWTCNGTYGGTNSPQCTEAKPAPNPPTIVGAVIGASPANAQVGNSYQFNFTATNPSGDNIVYDIDWDNNGTVDNTLGPVTSGTMDHMNNGWAGYGAKYFKAKTRVVGGPESGWVTFQVNVYGLPVVTITPGAASTIEYNGLATYSFTVGGGTYCSYYDVDINSGTTSEIAMAPLHATSSNWTNVGPYQRDFKRRIVCQNPFSQTDTKDIYVTVLQNDAACGTFTVPSYIARAATTSVSVTMTNTGTNPWHKVGNSPTPHRLGSWNPQDNTLWTLGRLELAADTPSLATGTFMGTVTAPAVEGDYLFGWRMLEESLLWFGGAGAGCEPSTAFGNKIRVKNPLLVASGASGATLPSYIPVTATSSDPSVSLTFTPIVAGDSPLTKQLYLNNLGGGTISGINIAMSDATHFTYGGGANLSIGPGGEISVPISFSANATGTFGAFAIVTAPGQTTINVPVGGTATDKIIVSNDPFGLVTIDPVDFGSTATNRSRYLYFTVKNNSSSTTAGTGLDAIVTGGSGAFSCAATTGTTCKLDLPARGSQLVRVKFSPTILGQVSAVLTLGTSPTNTIINLTGTGVKPEFTTKEK